MAEIRPFYGIRYNQTMIDDLDKVICPPYDIISPQMRQELYHRSQYNFIRLEDSRDLPQDTPANSKYTRSAATLEQWLTEGILKPDKAPAIYLHDHHFIYQGRKYRRRGIIVRAKLAGRDADAIRPHEGTLTEPKSDRLRLLWALQANTSPILALFEDREHQVASLLAPQAQNTPVVSSHAPGAEGHYVWAITEPKAIRQLCGCLADQPLYIADGHHRYESALTYQRERRACSTTVAEDEAYDFAMMTLVDFADPGLLILPPHRLVRGVPPANMNRLADQLRTFFYIEELPLLSPDTWQQADDFLTTDTDEVRLILFGTDRDRLLRLRLRDPASTNQMMPYFHSDLYKGLAVSVVDHVLLEKLLELQSDSEEDVLSYSYDKRDAVQRVEEQEYQLALLLSPIRAEVIKAIANAGDRMPRKSTYFYPKPPSGLVFYHMV